MNIGFVFANFNNSSLTREAIKSLEKNPHSAKHCVVVVDNRSNPDDVASLRQIEQEYKNVKVIYNQDNVGYFRGLNVGIKHLRQTGLAFDCIVVGNNDLVFPSEFFDKVANCLDLMHQYAVISPDLVTLDGVHQNPLVRTKITAFRKIVWDIYYFNYQLALLIRWIAKITSALSERKDFKSYKSGGVVYSGYGACYILTPVFFQYFEELLAPTFLMGEEFFLTTQLAGKGLEVYYEPSILVHHHDHATTDKVPSKKLWEIYRKSHHIQKKYGL
jgi:GT2 family glycosyltransferase